MTLSGASGNPLGSLQRPELNQQQQTATDQVAKQGAVLLKDTLEIPLSQLGGNIWKYKSDADRPLLPMYLQRAAIKKDPTPGEWGKILDQLKNDLPDSIKQLLAKPNAHLDPRLKGMLKSLERFAKTLNLLRGAPLTITSDEQKKREKEVAARDLSFLEELLNSAKKVLPQIPQGEIKNGLQTVLQAVSSLLPQIISKRKKQEETEGIFLTIESFRKELSKAYGERTPHLFFMFLTSLEELHQLSYPGASHAMLHLLLKFETMWGKGDLSLVGPTFKKIANSLIKGEGHLFVKERRTLITLLLAITFTLLTFGVQKDDIADTLSLALFFSEKILLNTGASLLGGLFLTPVEARAVGEDLLGALVGLLLADAGEQDGVMEVLERPVKRLLQSIVKRHKGEEEPFLQRVLLALESGRSQELFGFAQEGLQKLGLKEEQWMRDLRAFQVFYTFIANDLEDKKEGGEMILFSQSA